MLSIDLDIIVHFLSIIFFLAATLITANLYRELKNEKYWIGLPLGVLFFFLHEISETLQQLYSLEIFDIIAELSEVIGAFLIMYACFGLRNVLKNVNKIMNENDGVNSLED